MRRRDFLALSAAVAALPARWAAAATGPEELRVLSEGAPNSFDGFGPGLNRNAIQVSWNCYDRLLGFGTKPAGEGVRVYDYYDLRPELAESWEVSEDGRAITFRLRPEATFHDGTPVTAADVKFSLDRVVASPVGKAQFSTGSMTDPGQFVVLDAHTLRIDLPQADRFALPNLALTYPVIVNARAVTAGAGEADPWGHEWLKTNVAGGGAFRLAEARPGERILFERFGDWRSGPRPALRRVLWQTVPEVQTRIAALKRGDADLVQDLPPREAGLLAQEADLRVAGVPTAAFQFIGMNSRMAPFDDVRVRRAVAAALPYEAMFALALQGRGEPLFGGSETVTSSGFPQPMGTATDPARARALLAEAGLGEGFETSFSFDLSQASVAEPIAVLVQEALGAVGIRATIDKVPSGQLGSRLQEKSVPLYFEGSIAFLRDPDYFFRIFYSGDTRWNFGSFSEPEFDALVAQTRYERDPAAYETAVRRMIEIAKRDVPIILLWHPTLDTAMRRDVEGYSFLFHRMLDLRPLGKA